jgi:hypothetical protein
MRRKRGPNEQNRKVAPHPPLSGRDCRHAGFSSLLCSGALRRVQLSRQNQAPTSRRASGPAGSDIQIRLASRLRICEILTEEPKCVVPGAASNWAPDQLMLKERPSRTIKRLRFACLKSSATLFALAASFGCSAGDGLNRQAVSGTVSCDGNPVATGAILFEPATYQSGTAVGATIRKGSFTILKRDGPVPGTYKVRIYMSSGIQAAPAKGQTDRSPRPMVEFLPEQYNAKTRLRADVSEARPNRFRFDVSSLPSAVVQ